MIDFGGVETKIKPLRPHHRAQIEQSGYLFNLIIGVFSRWKWASSEKKNCSTPPKSTKRRNFDHLSSMNGHCPVGVHGSRCFAPPRNQESGRLWEPLKIAKLRHTDNWSDGMILSVASTWTSDKRWPGLDPVEPSNGVSKFRLFCFQYKKMRRQTVGNGTIVVFKVPLSPNGPKPLNRLWNHFTLW